jgi:hypothetical protein
MSDSMVDRDEVTWRVGSAAPPGALAIIELRGASADALDVALARLGLGAGLHRARHVDLLGIDQGMLVRWSQRVAHMTPHAGPAVLRAICDRLGELGVPQWQPPRGDVDPRDSDSLRRAIAEALGRARSPDAVDLLLDQPRRWGETRDEHPRPDVLRRLIEPPLIVALGRPNIGKSTLVNALAGRNVSITADTPGATRDHVGVALDLAGIAAHYFDAPGIDDGDEGVGVDAEARDAALTLAERADLVLLCTDPGAPPIAWAGAGSARTVCLRSDLRDEGWNPAWRCDAVVSARLGRGLGDLVRVMRNALVPPEVLGDPRPWRFWESATGSPV